MPIPPVSHPEDVTVSQRQAKLFSDRGRILVKEIEFL